MITAQKKTEEKKPHQKGSNLNLAYINLTNFTLISS